MLQFYRRIGTPRRKPRVRSVGSTVRLHPEQLESRELLTIPLPPTGVVAKGISAFAIGLSWNASTDLTVTGYDVYAKVWIPGVHSPRGSGGTPGHYVYNLVASNEIPHRKQGGRLLFHRGELDEWLNSFYQGPGEFTS